MMHIPLGRAGWEPYQLEDVVAQVRRESIEAKNLALDSQSTAIGWINGENFVRSGERCYILECDVRDLTSRLDRLEKT